ncbi:MAG: sigma-70 family RNA polymerase sigma factor [Planctomycetota bacterium JB042]
MSRFANQDDPDLVALARSGDRAAFGELVRRHQDAVFRVVVRTSRVDRDRAEDLAQETFLRAYQALDRFRGDAPFRHWLFRIATNLTINRVTTVAARTERRAISLDEPVRAMDGERTMEPTDGRAEAPDARLERGELRTALAKALDRLPEEFRAAVVLRDVEGLEYDSIAAILEVPIGTVRSRLHRGREALREIVTRIYGVPALEAGSDGAVR